ncbi:Cytochrome P450 monooxygenase notG [Cladobotryum mycophilum]|uniref:Cytochrome P450 monooxygenase notG n=1 Tax=Cladobotryum mycophilum TaxID=491253 RepID=A0ABR0SIJ1_9HYPO
MSSNHIAVLEATIMDNTSIPSSLQRRLIASTVLAVALHHFVFKKGEWHLRAPLILSIWLLSYPFLFLAELTLGSKNFIGSGFNAILTLGCFTTVTFVSIAIYRIFFHQLSSFPGPRLAKVSKLWHFAQCWDGKNHLLLDDLHKKYGDFVRTGPNEITVFNPEGLLRLDGPGNRNTKSAWYDFLMPDVGVTTIRDKSFHDQRRKIWVQALSGKALPFYEQQMVDYTRKLDKLIQTASKNGSSVPFTSFVYWFSFDVMGMFSLSESFNMLHNENWHYAIAHLRRAFALLGLLGPVPWLVHIAFKFLKGYWIVKDWHLTIDWCRDRMQKRIRANDENLSIMSHLIADSRRKGSLEQDHHLLTGEAIVAIVAGSDTVASAMVFLFYELALNPSMANKIYEELSAISIQDFRALERLPYYNAFIKETTRLHPVVLTGGYRDLPPEGVTIAGRYIPGNTTVAAPRYTIFRSERCFEQADKFIPERWLSKPGMVKDSRSFVPFAQGRYTCVGKSLALSELRVVAALLVSRYHIHLPPGDNGTRVEKDMQDQFTAKPGKLDLVFIPRD